MTALDQLNAYLKRLELRLRVFAASRGTAIVAALALALTVLLVWISNRYAFAQHVVLPLRIVLFVVLATAVSFLLAIPLLKLNRRRVSRLAEQRVPQFKERLLTIAEKPDVNNPFTELVAEDALRVAREDALAVGIFGLRSRSRSRPYLAHCGGTWILGIRRFPALDRQCESGQKTVV